MELRAVQLRRQAAFIQVTVAKQEAHALGIPLLEEQERARHADRAADGGALVADVAAEDQPPAVGEIDACTRAALL